ncbi:MAG: immunity 51 family protein, partial [Syntrophobacterales bacterium]|nr:immunity 51 family protein [Syntrophobacterales bacterium]
EEFEEDSEEENDLSEENMGDYATTIKHENSISVCFYIEHNKPFAIGEKMNEINDDAYMNGYNWEAFFNYYLPKYAPDVLKDMDTDPEAGMYVAYYPLTSENEARAEKFVEIIRSLIENEEELYRIVREEGEEIEWD